MKLPTFGLPLDYRRAAERDISRPGSAAPVDTLLAYRCEGLLQKKIENSEVYICYPHKVPIHSGNPRFSAFETENYTVHVTVRFAHLKGTLLPFGPENEDKKVRNK